MAERDANGRWRKGTPSPNPAGRPHRVSLTETLKRQLDRIPPGKDRSVGEALIADYLEKVAAGVRTGATWSLREVDTILSRCDGRPGQALQIGLDDQEQGRRLREAQKTVELLTMFIRSRKPELRDEIEAYLEEAGEERRVHQQSLHPPVGHPESGG